MFRFGSRRPDGKPSVAVIGGGFAGIAAAVHLQRAGICEFVVYERSSKVGGTWWDNHYPGAETDAASHLYCYSFAPYPWTRTHVRRDEIRDYLEHVVDRFGIRDHFRFNQKVASVVWDEDPKQYVLTTGDGTERCYDAVISAVGMFNAPRYPELPGLDRFRGPALHTAHWDDTVDLTDQRVAVMGTGSSSSQIVPTIAGTAARVTVFQRQPAWLLPKGDRDLTERERRFWGLPGAWKLHRLHLYLRQDRREVGGRLFDPRSSVNTQTRQRALDNIDRVFADRPDLKVLVTPTHPFGGKRAISSSAFYESLLRDDVELVAHPLVACTEAGVVDAAGVEREMDVVILATGFQAADYLHGLTVIGRAGLNLHELWDGEPFAFLGLTVPKFPNFFMMYGPNTNGGLIVSNLEHQAAYAVREISRLGRGGVTAVEVREDVVRWYNVLLQKRIARTSFKSTDNYFQAPSGKIVTQWPDGASTYALLTMLLRRPSTFRRRSTGHRIVAHPRTTKWTST